MKQQEEWEMQCDVEYTDFSHTLIFANLTDLLRQVIEEQINFPEAYYITHNSAQCYKSFLLVFYEIITIFKIRRQNIRIWNNLSSPSCVYFMY